MRDKQKHDQSAAGHVRRNILFQRKELQMHSSGRPFLCYIRNKKKMQATSRAGRGSLTLEASLAVPLYFLCMVTLICFMNMYGMVARRTVDLQQKAEKAAMLAGVTQAAGVEKASALSVIDLRLPVYYEPVWAPVPMNGVLLACRGRVYSWVGRDPKENTGQEEKESDKLVYVTETGSVYHTNAKCTHIALSIQQVSSATVSHMRNAKGGKYHACEKCVRNQGAADVVYITNQGDRFHNEATCSGLTRNVRMVPISEVKHMQICSRCQELEQAEAKAAEKNSQQS